MSIFLDLNLHMLSKQTYIHMFTLINKSTYPLCTITALCLYLGDGSQSCLTCVLFYLLLAGGVVSGFTPVTYPARVSSECGQYDFLQDQQLIETLGQVQQQLDCHHPKNRSCHEILHCFSSCSSLRLLPDTCSQWLTSAGLLWHGGEQLWRRGRLDKSGLCQHVTVWCHLPSGTDTDNPLRTDSLWPEWSCRMSEHSVLHTRSELLSSVWTTTRLSTWFTRLFSPSGTLTQTTLSPNMSHFSIYTMQ